MVIPSVLQTVNVYWSLFRASTLYVVRPKGNPICYVQQSTSAYYPGRVHSGKRNAMVWRPSVCSLGILTVTHQWTACDAASEHFEPTTDNKEVLHNCLSRFNAHL